VPRSVNLGRSWHDEGETMKEKVLAPLSLEVEVIENRARPGCQNSSSTSPLCTCPIPAIKS